MYTLEICPDVMASGCTSLMKAILDKDEVEVLKIVVEDPLTINQQNDLGCTALHIVARHKALSIFLDILFEHGADPDIQDNKQMTALMYACKYSTEEVIIKLLHNNADPNIQTNQKWTVLLYACQYSTSTIVRELLNKNANPNNQTIYGETALQRSRSYETTKILLEAGADVTLVNEDGNHPLIYYLSRDFSMEGIKLLLDYKTNPNIQNNDGDTFLMKCKYNINIIYMLLDYGADPNIRNKKGLNTFDIINDVEILRYMFRREVDRLQQEIDLLHLSPMPGKEFMRLFIEDNPNADFVESYIPILKENINK
jgi:ankyrin repeat protein